MDKRKIIIDTDCGSDDAMAIAMALNDERYEILFFTTVSGNVHAHQAATNTLTTIERAGSYEPPVYIGCTEMLLKKLEFAYETHGQDGMGDIGLAPTRLKVAPGNGVLKILEALEAHEPNTIDIITLGTLTNIAVAMRLAPDTMRRVRRIVSMGTAGLGTGNVSPVAEVNIWQDAEAARIVTEFGVPLVYVGWDACLGDAILGPDDLKRLTESGPLGRFAVECNRQLMEMNEQRFGYPCLDMADPAAMAAALEPDCIAECDEYYCEVDTSNGPSYGGVLVDTYRFSGKQPNAAICSKLHADRFKEYLFRTLGA